MPQQPAQPQSSMAWEAHHHLPDGYIVTNGHVVMAH